MSTMSTIITSNDFSDLFEIERAEMEGLTAVFKYGDESIPLKITYDPICVYSFETFMETNVPKERRFSPHPIFNAVKEFAEKEIDDAINAFKTKDASKTICQDSWQIKNGFVTIDICLQCCTEYDTSDFVFEDVAIHSVVVSMSASFNTNKVYYSESHATEVFKEVTNFYIGLKTVLTE